jgi:hypothetical protein
MMTRAIAFAFVCGTAVVLSAHPPPALLPRVDHAKELVPADVPGRGLPIVREHTYVMSGKVRALVMWIGRDDVGSGVIRWRGEGSKKAFELLIGSDPLRAPGKLNKWGYLAEEVRGVDGEIVGIISKDSEQRLSDVKAGTAGARDARPFDTIRARVTSSHAYARVSTVQASNTWTYREAGAMLDRMFGDMSTEVKQIGRPAGVRAGFLSAMSEFIGASLHATPRGGQLPRKTIPYIHGDRQYELRALEVVPVASFEKSGRSFHNVLRGRFETGQAGSRGPDALQVCLL